jgi:pyruvate/2-oxoglutarate dehydrogenase complex dihydrolipoamide dehydrogenase (E3) component
MCTHVPHIDGISDMNGKMGQAHVASAQHMVVAEAIAGRPTKPLSRPS